MVKKITKVLKLIIRLIEQGYSHIICLIIFFLNGIRVKSFICYGIPYVNISLKATCIIGDGFKMHNGTKYSDSGVNGKCRIDVRDTATLIIGKNVGISDVTITCHEYIKIGDNVLIGVGAQIKDTDNHSLNPNHRLNAELDWKNKNTLPIIISENVFIGANAYILKGVKIGKNSIIGAGSVVTKDVPENQIWAGNPAKLIKLIDYSLIT